MFKSHKGTAMIPLMTRNRRPATGTSGDVTVKELFSKVKRTSISLRQVPVKYKWLFILLVILLLITYGRKLFGWADNRLTKEEFLQINKCPACYGRSMCFELFDDQVELSGMSQISLLDYINVRNVHFAYHKGKDTKLVLKKLSHNDEMIEVDAKICADAFRSPICDVSRVAAITKSVQDIHKNGLQPKHLKDDSFMFMCSSHKLIDRVLSRYKEKTTSAHIEEEGEIPHILLDDKIQIWFTAKVNAEPLLLQTFPKSEGWPFPEYYGACGRYVAVEHGGKMLSEFYHSPWEKRAELAYQMVKMAEKLSEDSDWALYWTDLAYENFAVDAGGKLVVIDAENIIAVDKSAVRIVNPKTWDELHESTFDTCEVSEHGMENCLSFDVGALCTHANSDHNYYAACRNMLSRYADDTVAGRPGGLLHHMPAHARDDWDLEHLLNECARPTQPQGRVKVIPQLVEALAALRWSQVKLKEDIGKRLP